MYLSPIKINNDPKYHLLHYPVSEVVAYLEHKVKVREAALLVQMDYNFWLAL